MYDIDNTFKKEVIDRGGGTFTKQNSKVSVFKVTGLDKIDEYEENAKRLHDLIKKRHTDEQVKKIIFPKPKPKRKKPTKGTKRITKRPAKRQKPNPKPSSP